ncbi:SMP-30/gluconolactonase/LRE family protein [Celeribacter marinus]|uniref:1,4-lactonase n=1 Tax=Celeribacter marinus TaxID=1397108 RepID=A0A0N9ZJA0_9RHOB|nr:SMP-30/gluconolactonase/LRE family protein [Celeribacter marinus]ALI56771.1 1,4-lactonase [Celeribacter marinus]SFL00503.1 Sugar lactone lactonase YvrE [Celeribacter marinus]
MSYYIYDETRCELGEGPLWHPIRNQLFWFDIMGMRLHTRVNDETVTWQFDEYVSAAGWVDENTLLMASETSLSTFDIATGETSFVCALEADNPDTRSNDGRADPQGGFWIGTMGKASQEKAGSIYRYYRGTLRKLFGDITITNSICFSPDGTTAYFCDTRTDQIMRVALNDDGWPHGKPEVFIANANHPDGSVVDADGNLWNAQWGSYRVCGYAPTGEVLRYIDVGGLQSSCPAFGGADGTTMFVTSAQQNLTDDDRAKSDEHGAVFAIDNVAKGQKEHQVFL